MGRNLAFFLLFLLSGCSTPSRLTIQLRNDCEFPLQVEAKAGPFTQTIVLWPYMTFYGMIPVVDTERVIVIIKRKE